MTVKDKHDGFTRMRAEFARANETFDRYAERFRDDVRTRQQRAAAVRDDVEAMRSTFERTTAAFDAYAASFGDDVATRHEAVAAFREEIEATRAAFEGALAEFERYAEAFDRDVGTKREAAAAFHEEVADTRAAFEAALDEFESYAEAFDADVEAKRRQVEPFLEAVDGMRNTYERARRDLDRAVTEFYGYDEPSASGTAARDGDAGDGTGTDEFEDDEAPPGESTPLDAQDGADRERPGAGGSADAPAGEVQSVVRAVEEQAGEDVPEDMVACLVCGEYYQAITESHLRTHDMSMAEYKEEFGDDVPLYPGEE